jgi:hypothetical protein
MSCPKHITHKTLPRGLAGTGVDVQTMTADEWRTTVKLWYKDEPIEDIPDPEIISEGLHRQKMWQRRTEYNAEYRQCLMQGRPTPRRPLLAVHMWWKRGGEGAAAEWHLRIPSEAIEIPEWRMNGLSGDALAAALVRPIDCDYTTPGHKRIPAGHTYLMRLLDQGFSVFANERGIGPNEFVCPYVGRMFEHEDLGKHRSETGIDHRASVRLLGRFHPHVGGIDGPVELPNAGGQARDLAYYVRNGYGSQVNSRACKQCNAGMTYEFSESRTKVLEGMLIADLYVGDQFCPSNVTDRRRVSAQPWYPSLSCRRVVCSSLVARFSTPPPPCLSACA